MKKQIIKLIHWKNPKYFSVMSYEELSKWGIEDVYKGVIIFG